MEVRLFMSHLQNTNLIEIRQVYWDSNDFDSSFRSQAMNSTQLFVLVENFFSLPLFLILTEIRFSHGDPVGYGYHAGRHLLS
jgi:hypothetical protein